MRYSRLLLAATVIVLSGCTHLETIRDYETANLGEAVEGIPYALPALHYELYVEHQIVGCPSQFTLASGNQSLAFWDDGLKIKTKVAATPHYIGGERFVADYRSLASFMKTSGYGLETYPSGILKSINASAEDQTGSLIKDVVTAGLSIARLAGGSAAANVMEYAETLNLKTYGGQIPAAVVLPPPPAKPLITSTEEALAALAKLRQSTSFPNCRETIRDASRIRSASARLAESESRKLQMVTRQVGRRALVAANERSIRSDLLELDKALAAQVELEDAVQAARDALIEKQQGLVVTDKISWTPTTRGVGNALKPTDTARFNSMLFVHAGTVLRQEDVLNWWQELTPAVKKDIRARFLEFSKAYGVFDKDPPDEPRKPKDRIICGTESVSDCVVPGLTLYPSLTVQKAMNLAPKPDGARTIEPTADKASRGLFIRSQQLADFRLCVGEGSGADCPVERQVVTERGVPAPQLGQLRFLPFSNRPFEAAKLSIAMREDGSVEKFSYDRTKAMSSGSEVFRDAVTQYESYRDRREKEENDARSSVRTEAVADLDARIAIVTKQKALLDLQKPEEPDALEAIRDETAALTAEIALLNARRSKLEAEALLTAAAGS